MMSLSGGYTNFGGMVFSSTQVQYKLHPLKSHWTSARFTPVLPTPASGICLESDNSRHTRDMDSLPPGTFLRQLFNVSC